MKFSLLIDAATGGISELTQRGQAPPDTAGSRLNTKGKGMASIEVTQELENLLSHVISLRGQGVKPDDPQVAEQARTDLIMATRDLTDYLEKSIEKAKKG
jgi:hypothetical protein